MKWDKLDRDERISAIRDVYRPGMTATKIGAATGATRNQIIGYYTRNPSIARDCPLTKRKAPAARLNARPQRRVKPRVTLSAPPISQPMPSEPEPLHVDLMNLTSTTCRWPYGPDDHGVTTFCGNLCEVTDPYCDYHMRASTNEGRKTILP